LLTLLKLADHQFPVLNLPLQLLQTRVRAAAALPAGARRNDLTIVARQIRAVIQKSQQLGLYNINCEARLVLGEMGLQLNVFLGTRSTHLPDSGDSQPPARVHRSTGGAGDHQGQCRGCCQ
jgi:hypothetical protein